MTAEGTAVYAEDLETAAPFVPARYRVAERREESGDVSTLVLEPTSEALGAARPGQFNMLSAFGVGEIAISVSGAASERIEHTVRAVGAVSRALAALDRGALVGVRGPFGTHWGLEDFDEEDVVVMAGGIGLAPLRMAIVELVARARTRGGRCFLLVGARTPDDLVFRDDLEHWSQQIHVGVTVDAARPGWPGRTGLVTALVADAAFEPEHARAIMCGPEAMMRFSARTLLDRGVAAERIRISLERNMQCGVGLCGHCQLGPLLLCRDGPVVDFGGRASELLGRREL